MFENISFDEDQIRLMGYLGNSDRESNLYQLSSRIIWNEANGGLKPPGMTARQNFLAKMQNSKSWADFYQKSVNWFLATNLNYTMKGTRVIYYESS